jgi:uncharacterized protein YktA (UPF0223 family)
MKLNLTLEMESKEEVSKFIHFIEQYAEIHNWGILTDTTNMYKEDSFFKSISKSYYKSRQVRNDYINKNNARYIK